MSILSMTVFAGLQILRVMAGIIAELHALGFDYGSLILQRHIMGGVALFTLRNVFAVVGNVSVRSGLFAVGRLEINRGFGNIFEWPMARQALVLIRLCSRRVLILRG